MIKKSRKNEEPKRRSTKEILQEWLQMNPKETPKPKTNEEMIAKGMIESAKNGDSRSFQTINSIINGTESGETPSLQIQVVDNSRLEKFLYMTDEESLNKFKQKKEENIKSLVFHQKQEQNLIQNRKSKCNMIQNIILS